MNIESGKQQRQKLLLSLLSVNLIATVLHFTDNFFAFERYPAPVWMTPEHVYVAWLVLAPFAIAGYVFYIRQAYWMAYACLGIYSLTSLAGVAHYLFGAVSTFSVKMHAFIWFEELAGYALLGFIAWSAFKLKEWQYENPSL